MKKLLATTAIATMAFTGAASAQSLLERVLESTNTQEITGIFANTADNVLNGAVPNSVTVGGDSTTVTTDRVAEVGDVITVFDGVNEVSGVLQANGTLLDTTGAVIQDDAGIANIVVALAATLLTNNAGALTVATTALTADVAVTSAAIGTFVTATETTVDTTGGDIFETSGINASITNILRGLDGPTAVTDGGAEATEAVTALIGNLSTTALGAVNTGDIELIGSNLSFSEDIDSATAGTSEAIQQTIDHTITQVGTTADQTMLAINSALNETNVDASVMNVMTGVNASIGRSGFEIALSDTNFSEVAGMDADAIAALTGGISTTALGAVNTGTIISGANDQVNGVITSIVGNAATNTE